MTDNFLLQMTLDNDHLIACLEHSRTHESYTLKNTWCNYCLLRSFQNTGPTPYGSCRQYRYSCFYALLDTDLVKNCPTMAESFKTIRVCGNSSRDTLTPPIIKAIATAFSVYSQTTGIHRLINSAFSVTMIANLTLTCTYKTVLQNVNQPQNATRRK